MLDQIFIQFSVKFSEIVIVIVDIHQSSKSIRSILFSMPILQYMNNLCLHYFSDSKERINLLYRLKSSTNRIIWKRLKSNILQCQIRKRYKQPQSKQSSVQIATNECWNVVYMCFWWKVWKEKMEASHIYCGNNYFGYAYFQKYFKKSKKVKNAKFIGIFQKYWFVHQIVIRWHQSLWSNHKWMRNKFRMCFSMDCA